MTLSINNVSFAYQKERIIKDLSLTIDSNQIVGLVGLSGSGKTTLLKILSGLLVPQAGTITINGIQTFIDQKRNRRLYENVGVIFQEHHLFMHLKVIDNVALAYRLKNKTTKQQSRIKAEAILDRFGLKEHIDKFPYQCSGGQQQRIAIARALILDPMILFVDEPTSALDQENTHQLVRLLKELNQSGLTVVVITHDLPFAEALCDRIIEMSDGVIIDDSIAKDYFIKR